MEVEGVGAGRERAAALTPGRRILVAMAFCAGAAYLAGPEARMVVALALLLVAPGYLITRALPCAGLGTLPRLALQIGLSLSAIALLYQWAWFAGLALNVALVQILAVALAAAALAAAWHDFGAPTRPRAGPRSILPWTLFGLVCLLTLWTRFVQIEGLVLPVWVDSIHHAVLVRVTVERGVAPIDVRPYMLIPELAYHWGYHVLIAAMIQISGLDLAPAMLWSGQILNALHAPMAGALAMALWRQPSAALGAALAAGLISYFPAYYVSWGRYTQLTGLLLLPGLAIAWQAALEGGGRRWWAALALLLAGLFLIHVRVMFFGLVLLAAMGAVWALDQDLARVWRTLPAALAAAAGALALVLPWLALLVRRAILPAIARPEIAMSTESYAAISEGLLWAGQNRLLAALALAGALWAIWRRRRTAAVLLLWAGLLILLTNLRMLAYLLPAAGAPLLLGALIQRRWFLAGLGALLLALAPLAVRIPLTVVISGDSVVITLFLPLSAAIGGGAAMIAARLGALGPRARAIATPLVVAATLALALWSAGELRRVVNDSTIIATQADLAAIEWVRDNTPPDARFLINATPWFNVAARGSDGGWWLLPLAGRWVSTPPVLFTFGPTDYAMAAIERSQAVIDFKPGQEQTMLERARNEGISYIFFGARGGPLRPELFRNLPGITTVYERDGVTILALGSQS